MNRVSLLIIALLIASAIMLRRSSEWKSSERAQLYLPLLNAAEKKYKIPHDLLARQAFQESRFRLDIVSGLVKSTAGAVGIMQIVPKWHPGVDPLNVPEAIDYAARYLKSLYAKYGSWRYALAAYNAGPGNVDKYLPNLPPFKETQKYVQEILTDVPV